MVLSQNGRLKNERFDKLAQAQIEKFKYNNNRRGLNDD
jgi:hypothetical protein